MELYLKHFSELDAGQLYAILAARSAVFVVEQNCAYQDIDGLDQGAYHMWYEDENGIAAYVRILPPGARFDDPAIGRVLTTRRGCGLGFQIMQEALKAVRKVYGAGQVTIEAQVYAEGFYNKLGFVRASDEFDEDGIPHILMKCDINRL